MSGKYILLVALAVTAAQVQATSKYVETDFVENVRDVSRQGQGRIVSGWDALPGQHPHQVALRLTSVAGQVFGCGGSVVHRSWVLTAAHCTASRIWAIVRAGVTNATTPEYMSESRTWYNHPTFNENTPSVVQPNDISIVKLDTPVVYSDFLRPIRLQSAADSTKNYEGLVVQASGYGNIWTSGSSPEVMQWVFLTAVSNPTCFLTFGSIITDNTVCARYYNVTSQSTCQGDSGGPLVLVEGDGTPILIGVTSFVAGGNFGCHSGLPAGFIRPGPFHGWLTEITGIDFENIDEEEEEQTPEPEQPDTETEEPETEEPETEPPSTENPGTEAPDTEEPETEAPETEPEPETPDKPEKPETESSDEDNKDCGDSSEEDKEMSNLLKRLQVIVNVKVQLNKYKKNK